jgi:DNA-binding NarL/FixJ family response regulator
MTQLNAQSLNLFIVDDDKLMATGLRNYLDKKFGAGLRISTFTTGKGALEEVNADTGIVILDYFLEGENGNEILLSIKKINPKTEVIMLSSNKNMAVAIDSFRKGASGYIVKGRKAWEKVSSQVYAIIIYPVNVIAKEFGVSKYVAAFLLTFAVMGIAVLAALRFFR